MREQSGRAGGITALNSGEIKNCYSVVRIKAKNAIAGGFTGENNGKIENGVYSGSIQKLNGGVSGAGVGKLERSWCFYSEPEESVQESGLLDTALARNYESVAKEEDAAELGFDTQDIWEYIGGPQVLRFQSKNWLFDPANSSLYSRYMNEGENTPAFVSITTAEELIEFATKINGGDKELSSAYIRLERDIDLGGKEWTPIGIESAKAFSGLFDGCGHTVGNFIIKSKATKAKGFFGHLKGEVYNIAIDCLIKGGAGTVAGGVAAFCEGGVIGCSAATVEIRSGIGKLGGLAGFNTGAIFHSYAAGLISSSTIAWYWFAPLLLLLLLLIPRPTVTLPDFAPVPLDSGIRPVEGNEISPRTDGNFVSFQFDREIDVDAATCRCVFNFINPGDSNHNVVVQLHFTDSKAASIMGSTGRSAEEQKKLDDNPNYDPENYRTVIAESGAVPPGYRLDNLVLTEHSNGAKIPPGDYSATVYLIFYDIETNNRAMMESQLPVTLHVHN